MNLKCHIRASNISENIYIEVQTIPKGAMTIAQVLTPIALGVYSIRVDGRIVGQTENPAEHFLTFCEINDFRLKNLKAKYYEEIVDWSAI